MAHPETLSAPGSAVDAGPPPEVSVVVTLFDEASTLDELHRRLSSTLTAFGRPFEVLDGDRESRPY